ncbi:MAG TPA: TonB-dependent receptor plug domain-containing protein, partial [Woeseiaceae bacterium]
MKIALRVTLPLVFAAIAAPPVQAQTIVLEEIVVTARKRAESLEESPVSVRAFTASEIQSAGIETPHDFIALTPNATLVQTQNAGNSFINIRGISQARNSEMSVAVLVDGVLMANPAQFNQQLFDIEQIEVLRGPQGALYGRNAIGGAITIVTQQPTDALSGKVELGADSGPGYTVRGSVSGPLGESEAWKFRVSASYVDTDGYIDNPFLGEEADPYKDVSARAVLVYQPSDDFSADFRVTASAMDTQALYFNIAAEADDTSLPVRVNNAGINERDLMSASLKLEWARDFGTVSSITAYDDLEEILTGDQFDFLPRPESFLNTNPFIQGFADTIRFFTGDAIVDLSQTQFLDTDSWSQEFRYISPTDRRLRWIAGVYGIS